MKKITCALCTLLVLLFKPIVQGQTLQAGGFSYGWEAYDNSDSLGLGQREILFDTTGLRTIAHAPPVGIHPRIFFGPDEIPGLRNRLEQTLSGQAVAAQIHAFTTLLQLGAANYNHSAAYGLDSDANRWIDNTGFWDSREYYTKLIVGDNSVWDGVEIKRKHITACLMALEAFECLIYQGEIDEDTGLSYTQRASELATAMAFWASMVVTDPTINAEGNNFNHFGGTHMALAFDLNFHALTEEQATIIRQALAQITPDLPRHGGQLPAFANQSNWSSLNSFEIMTNLAIEGEEGYKEELTERWMRAYHNFITYGWYPSGAGYEGLGKNYQFVTTMIACAKRGYSLLGHPHVRAYAAQFLPAITQPFGYGFTSYDVWGGSGHDPVLGGYKFSPADVVGLKWIFPDDERVDFVWRNYIEKAYNSTSAGYVYQQIRPDDSYYNYLIPAAVFCQDYDTLTNVVQPISHDYFAADRGLAVFKSGVDQDALAVQFHCRQDMGGHTHGDRNDFTLSALGRIWIRKSYGGSQFQPSWFHSCVLIDGLGMGVGDPDGDKCRQPGKILDYQSNEHISTIAGDATYAYSWEWHWSPQSIENDHPWLGTNGWKPVLENWADFQYQPTSEPHFHIPFYQYPHWHQPNQFERMVKRPYNTMEKVYRTLSVVRSPRPFVLIADDLRKDNEVHHYQWLAQLARDLEIADTDVNLDPADYRCDIILKEPTTSGNRRLLVRVLNNEGYDGILAPATIDTLVYFDYFNGNPYTPNPNYVRPRLLIESNSVEPEFKVLLFPYFEGDDLPTTVWNTSKDTLSVLLGVQEDRITFPVDENGRTQIELLPDVVNGLGEVSIESPLRLYPNPAQDWLTIDLDVNFLDSNLRLYNAEGRLMSTRKLKHTIETISIKALPQGIYWFELEKEGEILDNGKLIRTDH